MKTQTETEQRQAFEAAMREAGYTVHVKRRDGSPFSWKQTNGMIEGDSFCWDYWRNHGSVPTPF